VAPWELRVGHSRVFYEVVGTDSGIVRILAVGRKLRPTLEDAGTLRRLSEACGGWIVFDDVTEETWVNRSDWDRRFSAWPNGPGV
jgi:hypothetical protein